MPDIDDIHDAIVTIARLKVAVRRRQTRYVDQYNRLQSIVGGISRQYGFSPDSVTQAITGQVHSGDRSILVAGWVYRERIKLANSRRRLSQVNNRTQRVADSLQHGSTRFMHEQAQP